MKMNFLNRIKDNFLSLLISYRHIKVFYENYPQPPTNCCAFISKISLLHALSDQRIDDSKAYDTM